MNKILECSSKGDSRFSAFGAYITLFGVYGNIETHYQTAKIFEDGAQFNTWKEAKQHQKEGHYPVAVRINGLDYPATLLSQFYTLLWLRYFRNKPDLIEYAKQFDTFNDMFRSKNTVNCQADVIRKYVKHGERALLDDCKLLCNLINSQKS